jgi:hypothetical protein
MPNLFATIALVLWPLVALALFHALPVNRALIWTILGGQLLLPIGAAIKFAPGIPALDKISIPSVAALAGSVIITRRMPRFLDRFGLAELLLLMYLIGPFITSELNGDAIFFGGRVLPAIDQYEALSAAVAQFLFILPFLLGRRLLRTSTDIADIMRILVIAGLLYSPLMLLEIRMSPQLHRWVYGYSVIAFGVETRYEGFRPTVFMINGLVLAFFTMTSVVAASAFWQTRNRVTPVFPAGCVTAYLGMVLVLCKSMGALVYGAALVCLIRFTKPRLQLKIALVLATVAMAFPALRSLDVFPTVAFVDIASSIDNERAASLKFRFVQEDQLLRHASERLLFGWGRFGRNRIFDEDGRDLSVTDGQWIITVGQFGIFGFVAEFGLLVLPVFRAASALKFVDSINDRILLAALALILVINVIDLLPNASLSPWTWLIAGALLGRAETLTSAARQQRKIKINPDVHRAAVFGRVN